MTKRTLDHAPSPNFHRVHGFFVRIFIRPPCHFFDRNAIERNRLSINTRTAPFLDKLRCDF